LTEFLVDVLGVEAVDAQFTGRSTYHGCCHLLRELGIDRQPRTLLQQVNGAEWVALNGEEECCGFGGLFAVKNSGISTAMGNRKVQNLVRSDADVVALCDVSCMTHINGLLSRQGERCRAVHIAQVLANQVDVRPRHASRTAFPASGETPALAGYDVRESLSTPDSPDRTACVVFRSIQHEHIGHELSLPYKKRVDNALHNKQLKVALDRATGRMAGQRVAAMGAVDAPGCVPRSAR
jgi:hypothetical protein